MVCNVNGETSHGMIRDGLKILEVMEKNPLIKAGSRLAPGW